MISNAQFIAYEMLLNGGGSLSEEEQTQYDEYQRYQRHAVVLKETLGEYVAPRARELQRDKALLTLAEQLEAAMELQGLNSQAVTDAIAPIRGWVSAVEQFDHRDELINKEVGL